MAPELIESKCIGQSLLAMYWSSLSNTFSAEKNPVNGSDGFRRRHSDLHEVNRFSSIRQNDGECLWEECYALLDVRQSHNEGRGLHQSPRNSGRHCIF